jgi:hypothetical protein
VTLISTGFIKDMSNMPTLCPSQRDILTANGESLKVAGKTIIEIQSDNLSFTFPFTTISLCGGITTVSETVTL